MGKPPRRNRLGREIWFEYRDGGSEIGGYAPVHAKGWLTFAVAAVWLLVAGKIGFSMMAGSPNPSPFLVILAAALPPGIVTTILVYRHSDRPVQ